MGFLVLNYFPTCQDVTQGSPKMFRASMLGSPAEQEIWAHNTLPPVTTLVSHPHRHRVQICVFCVRNIWQLNSWWYLECIRVILTQLSTAIKRNWIFWKTLKQEQKNLLLYRLIYQTFKLIMCYVHNMCKSPSIYPLVKYSFPSLC